ncbi:D-2-hydroxyacid dehydrogenase [Paenibacillus methanolicus]|uniref:Glycerate dehydrogenase n=1 Tax=Paenibacillus methanolicus TaxID=582686 RepID=A0A5S5CI63_9BACL|nr:D-2-hydroxyacid dehydrogenase [Paenibacillus methanolicus]TYP77703.1 glycerate dehydrogenase [Paenibacillus methanolicus]
MNIVVLDGFTLNPGDLSWAPFEALGSLTVYDRTPPELVQERAKDADAVLTNKTALTADIISSLPNLRYIGVLATGYNVVAIEAAAERGITVTNVPDYSTYSVAQLVFAFVLRHCHHIAEHDRAVRGGRWSAGPDFTFSLYPLQELHGKSVGIIGFGGIGRQVARAAIAFGMDVLVHTRTPKRDPEWAAVRYVELDELLREADYVTLHCPLTPQTSGLINKRTIGLMKRGAYLINTARGGHVVEADLAHALREGRIAGAGLDVLSAEPPPADHPLIGAPNCTITPHVAWATAEARGRLLKIAADNLFHFARGAVKNKVG